MLLGRIEQFLWSLLRPTYVLVVLGDEILGNREKNEIKAQRLEITRYGHKASGRIVKYWQTRAVSSASEILS